MKIAITTPTGNIGSRLVQNLLDSDAELTLLARTPEKLPEAVRSRTTVKQGVLEDAQFVRDATAGADALFWLTPYSLSEPNQDARYVTLTKSASEAVTTNGIPYVINLSTFGAQITQGAGFASYLSQMEQAFNGTDAHVLHLRPGFFMENFLLILAWMRSEGMIPLPLPAATTLPMIATSDIADVAAKRLLRRDWEGRVIQGLHGPAHLRLDEAATILSTATGKPLHYAEIPMTMFRDVLRGMGASDEGIRCDDELMTAFARPDVVAEPRTAETTTPTTLQEWGSAVLAPLFK